MSEKTIDELIQKEIDEYEIGLRQKNKYEEWEIQESVANMIDFIEEQLSNE